MDKTALVFIIIAIYIFGVIITSVICHYIDVAEEDIPPISWFWILMLPLIAIIRIVAIPLYIDKWLTKRDKLKQNNSSETKHRSGWK